MIKTLNSIISSIKEIYYESKEQSVLEIKVKERLQTLIRVTTSWENSRVNQDAQVMLDIMKELGDYKGLQRIVAHVDTFPKWGASLCYLMGPTPFQDSVLMENGRRAKGAIEIAKAHDKLLRGVSEPIEMDTLQRVFGTTE